MGLGIVGDLVTDAGLQSEGSAILQFCVQFSFQAKQDMAFAAPVICPVTRCVFDHTNPDIAALLCPPEGTSRFAFVLDGMDIGPVGKSEGDVGHFHERYFLRLSAEIAVFLFKRIMYLRSIEYFRAIAIVLIVAGHCFAISGWIVDSFAELVLANIISGGTSLFVFISGFLFHHVFYRTFDYRQFMLKKIRNVYFPYLFLSIFGIWHALVTRIPFPEYYFGPDDTLYDQVVRPALLYLWTGGVFVYWYIPFIMGMFLLSPLFIRFIESSRRFRGVLICLTLAISLFMHRPVNNFSILQSMVFFLPVYLFGMCCSLEKEWIYARLSERLWLLLIGAILLAMLQAGCYGCRRQSAEAAFYL